MDNNELISLLKELKISLQSNTVIELINKEGQVNIDDLNDAIEGYIANSNAISDEPLIKTLIQKTKKLIEYTNYGDFRSYVVACTPPANYIINSWKELDQVKKELLEDNTVVISEEEFSKRYDTLLESLNFVDEEPNLVLESLKDHIPFQVFNKENNLYIVPLTKASKPMWFSKESLVEAIYKTQRRLNQYEATIVEKLNDNSIFDYILKNKRTDNLAEALKEQVSRQTTDIFLVRNEIEKLQKNEEELSEAKKQLEIIVEQSKVAKKEYEDAKEAAVNDTKLKASISYWKEKESKHNKRFRRYSIFAVALIILLIGALYWIIVNHQLDINFIQEKDNNTSKVVESNSSKEKNVSNPIKVNTNFEDSNQTTQKSSLDDSIAYLHYFGLYALLIFTSSSALWIIRITVKIALSNLHLSEDAHERVVMIQTYLAFINEGHGLEENDKQLILTSLFRPSNIGIIKDESSITVADIITAFKK